MTQEFNISVEYRAGSKMGHVDALSRNPVKGHHSHQDTDVFQVDLTNTGCYRLRLSRNNADICFKTLA